MCMTRREFLIGGAAFTSLGAFAGNRFSAMTGTSTPGGKLRLRFGVLSDIHIMYTGAGENLMTGMNNLTFKHALEWYRSQNVDAVVLTGDMADRGMDDQLAAVAEAWYSVFPDDKYPDGRPVEKVFVTGNHDWVGYVYADQAKKQYPDDVNERNRHILRRDMAKHWSAIFHEPYAPIYSKSVKGYTFIGSHWDSDGCDYEFGRIKDWIAENGRKIDPKMPFFYLQHPHLKDTCYGSWAWGRDKGIATKTLSAFPNAVAFSGHSHYSLTDERTIWQGAFTSVGASSLRDIILPYDEFPPAGYENSAGGGGAIGWKYNAQKLLPKMKCNDCRQGMLWSVYDDCITVRRREFLSNLDLGPDLVMPLPSAESRPFAFSEHAKKFHAPEFPADGELRITSTKAKSRGGKSRNGKERIPSVRKDVFRITVPPTIPDEKARLFSLEFVAKAANGVKKIKLLLAEGYNHALGHRKTKVRQACFFAKDELGSGNVRFIVTPMNCFGARGKPLVAEYKA